MNIKRHVGFTVIGFLAFMTIIVVCASIAAGMHGTFKLLLDMFGLDNTITGLIFALVSIAVLAMSHYIGKWLYNYDPS